MARRRVTFGTVAEARLKHIQVIQRVVDEMGVSRNDLFSQRRNRDFVAARAHLAFLLREKNLSYPEIGHIMNRDHTSIMHLLGATKEGKIYAEKFDRKYS